jgi:hypothetical protein
MRGIEQLWRQHCDHEWITANGFTGRLPSPSMIFCQDFGGGGRLFGPGEAAPEGRGFASGEQRRKGEGQQSYEKRGAGVGAMARQMPEHNEELAKGASLKPAETGIGQNSR